MGSGQGLFDYESSGSKKRHYKTKYKNPGKFWIKKKSKERKKQCKYYLNGQEGHIRAFVNFSVFLLNSLYYFDFLLEFVFYVHGNTMFVIFNCVSSISYF